MRFTTAQTLLTASFFIGFVCAGCSGLPESVKSGSREIKSAHQKFGQSHEKFLEAVRVSLSEFFDLEINNLEAKREKALAQAKHVKTSEFLGEMRKNRGLKPDAPVPLTESDIDELSSKIDERQRRLGETYDEGIKKLYARRRAVEETVETLKQYHREIEKSVIALDTYVQLEKADEVLWKEVKRVLNDRVDISGLEARILQLQGK